MKEKKTSDRLLSQRKDDHISLALDAQMAVAELDNRFCYEPLMAGHPQAGPMPMTFMGFHMDYPVWISSMTGGTERARLINERLAALCRDYRLGMGLGSCRSLLDSDDRLADFNMRPIIGPDQPLFANLGIAQVEQLVRADEVDRIANLIERLQADGLIVHINPLQEWTQPEGDHIASPPIETITALVARLDTRLIVKEVGQGMGPRSLDALMKLPLAAIEFGAAGGTNFSKLERQRADDDLRYKDDLTYVGHTAEEMTAFVRDLMKNTDNHPCTSFIISGGVKGYLHGYALMSSCPGTTIYGQASAFLTPALASYEALTTYFEHEMAGLRMAAAYLKPANKMTHHG